MRRLPVLLPILVASLVVTGVAILLLGRTPFPSAEAASGTVGAKAFAKVRSDGLLYTNQSRNVNSATEPKPGLYCLKLAVTVKNVVVSVNAASAPRMISAGLIGADGTPPECPDGTDVFVRAVNATGTATDAPFYILMH